MTWYYVDSNLGTKASAGGYGSQQTGAMSSLGAANVYPSIHDVYGYNTIAYGDRILIADNHSKTAAMTAISASVGANPGDVDPVVWASVDTNNIDQYKPGAYEKNTTTGSDFAHSGMLVIAGIEFIVDDNIDMIQGGAKWLLYDTTLEFPDQFFIDTREEVLILINSTLRIGNQGSDVFTAKVCTIEMYGGSIQGIAADWDGLISTSSVVEGLTMKLVGVNMNTGTYDLSSTGTVFKGIGGATDGNFDLTAIGCKIPSGAQWSDTEFTGHDKALTVFGSGVSDETTFHIKRKGGTVDHETTTVRTDGSFLPDGATRVSAKVVTNPTTNLPTRLNPFRFELPLQNGDLSVGGGTQKIRLYLTSDTALTNEDVFAIAGYSDSANNTLFNLAVSSALAPTGAIFPDPWKTGSALTTDSTSTWSSGKTYKYQIDIDTSGDAGMADSAMAPNVQIFITKANVTIYFDTEFDYVA